MSDMARQYPYVYTRRRHGIDLVTAIYDSEGLIGAVFLYAPLGEKQFKADLESLKKTDLFAILQQGVNQELEMHLKKDKDADDWSVA